MEFSCFGIDAEARRQAGKRPGRGQEEKGEEEQEEGDARSRPGGGQEEGGVAGRRPEGGQEEARRMQLQAKLGFNLLFCALPGIP